MVLDEQLLRKAADAGAALQAAERRLDDARTDYHTSVRRLHLGGASLREIARALSVSHQRVQQIVDAAGGTWWQRVWRTRHARHQLLCTFCEEAPSESSKLIAGPDVFVCDACVALVDKALSRGRAGSLARAGARSKAVCSFCAKRQGPSRRVAKGATAAMCADCLTTCEQILRDRA
jgi:ClpX C4-type zinc finger